MLKLSEGVRAFDKGWMFRCGFICSLLALGSGCGAAATNPYGADPYGDYGTGSSSYGSAYGGADSGNYGGLGGEGYGYGASFAVSPSPNVGAGSFGEFGSSYGDERVLGVSPSPSRAPQGAAMVFTPPVLNVLVTELRRTGILGLGRSIAKVEVSNPGDRALNGLVRVTFTSRAKPMGQIQSERVTLQPKERRFLTFSVDAWGVDDAEATVLTETPPVDSVRVRDRGVVGAAR